MVSVTSIPVLSDNYVWILERDGRCAIVDPGELEPVQRYLKTNRLDVEAILLTHHHGDHVAGVIGLAGSEVDVYASTSDVRRIAGVTRGVSEGMTIEVLGTTFTVLETPGHTVGAVCYHGGGMVFTGDTMFSAGCGRLFEGTPQQMFDSLRRLGELPEATKLYCGHEYTEKNLAFAATAEPANPAVPKRLADVQALRAKGTPSLPSTIAIERAVNPFLRSADLATFTERRKARDAF